MGVRRPATRTYTEVTGEIFKKLLMLITAHKTV